MRMQVDRVQAQTPFSLTKLSHCLADFQLALCCWVTQNHFQYNSQSFGCFVQYVLESLLSIYSVVEVEE